MRTTLFLDFNVAVDDADMLYPVLQSQVSTLQR